LQQANQQTFSEQRQVNKLLIVVCKFSTSTTDIKAAQLHSFEWIYCPHRRSQVNEKTIIAANEEANYYEDFKKKEPMKKSNKAYHGEDNNTKYSNRNSSTRVSGTGDAQNLMINHEIISNSS
jgi:hypothetical protein